MRPILYLIASITIISCKPNLNKEQEELLVSIENLIDSSDYFLSTVDSSFAINATQNFNNNINYIKTKMPDTLDNNIMLYIDKYYGLRKGFRKLGENFTATFEELKISKEQISNLRHDIGNRLVEEQQLNDYLKLEMDNISLVFQSSKSISETSIKLVPLYEEMNPKIDSLISSSKEKYNLQ